MEPKDRAGDMYEGGEKSAWERKSSGNCIMLGGGKTQGHI